MSNGNLKNYMRLHPETDALSMLAGVGRGLTYVHFQGIVHGDLKAVEILVNDQGEPQLMDFGFSYDMWEPWLPSTSTSFSGNIHWLAPERLIPEQFGLSITEAPSTASDVYALGMVIYEVFSGEVPSYETANTFALVIRITEGARPSHPGASA